MKSFITNFTSILAIENREQQVAFLTRVLSSLEALWENPNISAAIQSPESLFAYIGILNPNYPQGDNHESEKRFAEFYLYDSWQNVPILYNFIYRP